LKECQAAWQLPDSFSARMTRFVQLLSEDPTAPTALAAPLDVVNTHVADSLTALSIDGVAQARSQVDIGSGAGLPGLVLAAALPQAQVDLVESVSRKCLFMEEAVSSLALTNVRVVRARAEEWGAGAGAGSYEVATARAVAPLATLLEYAAPLLELGGLLVAWKGRRKHAEEGEAERAADVLGLRLTAVEQVEPFAGSHHHHLHVYSKYAPTPAGYPRRAGMARKRPLGSGTNDSRPNG
jgi:16S rRNA (guanine527-N7)-methyltransferase